jgi:hypothetical protein
MLLYPSHYAEAMADNILTFACVAKIEHLLAEHDVNPVKSYGERIKEGIRRLTDRWQEAEPSKSEA